MNAEHLTNTQTSLENSLAHAERVLDGDTEYDGADAARKVKDVCLTALDLAKELSTLKAKLKYVHDHVTNEVAAMSECHCDSENRHCAYCASIEFGDWIKEMKL